MPDTCVRRKELDTILFHGRLPYSFSDQELQDEYNAVLAKDQECLKKYQDEEKLRNEAREKLRREKAVNKTSS